MGLKVKGTDIFQKCTFLAEDLLIDGSQSNYIYFTFNQRFCEKLSEQCTFNNYISKIILYVFVKCVKLTSR